AVCTGRFFPRVTSAIMTNSPKGTLGSRLALNSAVIAVGLAASPTVSGLVLTCFGWGALFVVPLVLALALLAFGFPLIHSGRSTARASIDVLSVVLGPLGLSALLYGLGEITHDPAPSIASLVAGAVVLGLFVWRQLALKDPLLNLRPLGHPRFAVGIVLVMVGMLTSFSMSILLPLYYEGALERTAFFAGLLLLGPVLVNAAFTFLGGRLFDKHGVWPLVPVGLVLVLVGQAGRSSRPRACGRSWSWRPRRSCTPVPASWWPLPRPRRSASCRPTSIRTALPSIPRPCSWRRRSARRCSSAFCRPTCSGTRRRARRGRRRTRRDSAMLWR
ncbi:MAG: MFS transporter, partial [Eggerthellaceae bacterium]